jgi:SAM-dependent methyltransferase
MKKIGYPGNELDLFRSAHNWKYYFSSLIRPCLNGHVLEVGAGIGGTTEVLFGAGIKSWTCMEPDPDLAAHLKELISSDKKYAHYKIINGDISNLSFDFKFDVILYIDVLEHIEKDALEINMATKLLTPGGQLVILSPAHQWLYSEFDKSIGHYRRYNRQSLTAVIPDGYRPVSLRYLDSAGVFVSLINRMLLHRKIPTIGQIRFWDKVIVPVSRIIDPLMQYRFGKSILGIWQTP